MIFSISVFSLFYLLFRLAEIRYNCIMKKFFENQSNTFVVGLVIGMVLMCIMLFEQGMLQRPAETEVVKIEKPQPEQTFGTIVVE